MSDMYITIYISISYTTFKADTPIHNIIGTTGTGTLLGHSSIFYEAFKSPEQFVSHAGGILLNAEISTHLHGLEVRSEAAVVPTSDGDVLASEHARVALREPGQRLDEGVV